MAQLGSFFKAAVLETTSPPAKADPTAVAFAPEDPGAAKAAEPASEPPPQADKAKETINAISGLAGDLTKGRLNIVGVAQIFSMYEV
jgi:hypothetical protein